MSVGHVRGGVHRGLRPLDRWPASGAPARRRASGPSPRGPRRPARPGVGQAGDDRLEQLGAAVGQRQHVRRTRCRSGRGGAPWGWAIATGSRVLVVGADAAAGCLVTQRRRRGDSPSCAHDGVDGVLGHLAVGGELAAGDRDDARRVTSSPCGGATGRRCAPRRGLPSGARSGRRPAQTPVTSRPGEARRRDVVGRVEQVVDVLGRAGGSSSGPV